MKKVIVTRRFSFEAAHRLKNYDGECNRLHGHSYKLKVSLSGFPNEQTGMLVDFKELKEIVDCSVIQVLDHQDLNKVMPERITTAESISVWIWDILESEIQKIKDKKNQLQLEKICLAETENNYVMIERAVQER